MARQPLPVDEILPRLVRALRERRSAVVRAPPGAGKTTRVPPAILDAGLAGEGRVVVLEPRRLAARAAARRIAFERGGEVGGEVGFQVRFERRAGRSTRLFVVTEGVLVRMLQEDPFLAEVGAVVFDELHERSLDCDLALAMVRKLQREARPELAVVAMSATIVPGEVARFLGDAPVVESEGRLFPVEVRYLERAERAPVHELAAAGVARALEAVEGDVLAFLPGAGEIHRTAERLEDLSRRRGIDLAELYGDLPAERQDAALGRGERRKVVLATNVAQTSVTVEGIGAVVDTGLARTLRFDPAVGLDRLELGRISRAAADQRAGRAGRTGPGLCLRLWTEAEQRSLAGEDVPEVRRVDLAGASLQLLAWGERDPAAFPWLERPPEGALARAAELLERLGASGARGITPLGRRMARLPVHPRIARLLLEGSERGAAPRAALAGALIAERDPFRSRRGRARHASESDVLDRVAALEELERTGRASSAAGELDPGAARFVLRARDQLLALAGGRRDGSGAGRVGRGPSRPPPEGTGGGMGTRLPGGPDDALLRALLEAYPDRVARRRERGSRRGVLASGRGVVLAEESAVLDAELFVCVELDAGRRGERAEALVRAASAVRREWLSAERLRESLEVSFDPAREAVVALRRLRFDEIVLEEAQVAPPEGAEVERVLAEAAAADLSHALPLGEPRVRSFLERVRSLRGWMPELDLPDLGGDELRALLPELCRGRRSFAELRSAPLLELLRGRLSAAQLRALEREAPERLEVPSGSRVALRYEPGRPPVLAVRIQEVFGLADTPRVAAGRVPVLLHLLAPNQRPQQVTDDLKSFWNGAYQDVRKELRRRYPKHAWPEDPWTAPARRRPGR